MGIKNEFIQPVIKSPREINYREVKPNDLTYSMLMIHQPKLKLKGSNVLEYIKEGERKGLP